MLPWQLFDVVRCIYQKLYHTIVIYDYIIIHNNYYNV